MAVLGTATDDYYDLDSKFQKEEKKVRKSAQQVCKDREARGDKSVYSMNQSWFPIPLHELVGQRIDYLDKFYGVEKEDGTKSTALRWCQGEVMKVLKDKKTPQVLVNWDAMPDVKGYETSCEEPVELLDSKWNKDHPGAWRKDLDIEIGNKCETDADEECNSVNDESDSRDMDIEESKSESEKSESESEIDVSNDN